MEKMPFSVDPVTGAVETFYYDHATDDFHIHRVEDVTPILELNKAQHVAHTDSDWRGDMHKVASIPMSIFLELEKKGITKDPKALKRWLNDSDNAAFRTRPGRV